MIWSPSTTDPGGVDREHAVGVAVEREPEVEAARAHAVRERVQVRRADSGR